eukprot:325880-Chlamydomonas_euryale.AAC.3
MNLHMVDEKHTAPKGVAMPSGVKDRAKPQSRLQPGCQPDTAPFPSLFALCSLHWLSGTQ